MLKEVRNLKPGDQIRWAVEGRFEVLEVRATEGGGRWRVLVRQVDWELETDEAGQAVIEVDTERARVPFDGNAAELDAEIAELMRRRKGLKHNRESAAGGLDGGSSDPPANTQSSTEL